MKLRKLEDYFIANFHRADAYQFSRYRLLLNASFFTSIFSLLYLIISIAIEFNEGVYLMIFNVVGFLVLPLLMKTQVPIKVIGNLYVLVGASAVTIVIYFSGGIDSPVFPWLIAPPVLALLIVSRLYAWVWTGVAMICLITFIVGSIQDYAFPVHYNDNWKLMFTMLSSSGIILIVVTITMIFESNTAAALLEVESQKKEIQESREELEAQHEELLITSQQLQDLNDKKDFLMEILAHDLKSPLANIQGLIGLIKRDNYEPDSLEMKVVDLIKDSSKKSVELIQKILNSENLENIVYNLKLENLDLGTVLLPVVEELRETAARKSITINFSIERNKPCMALVDRIFLTQVYENLLNNAIKFSPQGKSIYVSLIANNDRIKTTVQDEGPGIAKEEMGLLFKKFKKLSNKPTGGESSTGLGLSIVKHYTELLKGQVWCESFPGKGCSFIVELPIHK
jgi:signal transduction histidine kinase